MCIIASSYKRKLSKDQFLSCAINNPHGIGIAHVCKKETGDEYIKVVKFDHVFDAYEYFNKNIILKKESITTGAYTSMEYRCNPYVVHFRYASSGIPVTPTLIHPFVIDPVGTPVAAEATITAANTQILFHNGSISEWRDKFFHLMFTLKTPEEWKSLDVSKENFSDTRMAAIFAHYYGNQYLNFMLSTSNPNRFVIMKTILVHDKVKVITEFSDPSLFIDYNGISFSNRDYAGWELKDVE